MSTWNCLHLYAGADGISRVDRNFSKELSAIDFAPPAPPMFMARASDAQAVIFIELPVGWKGGWHASPKEQWVICLAGEMCYEAGDGTNFTLRAGSCIMTSDTHGAGHNSWNAGQESIFLAVVQVR